MTLFEQWTLVNYIANKDYGGNVISPDRFGQLTTVANIDLFKLKFGLPEDYQLGAPISRQYMDATQRLTDETRFLHTALYDEAVVNNEVSLPRTYFTLISCRYNFQRSIDGVATVVPREVEILTQSEASERLGNYTKRPTAKNPIGIIEGPGYGAIRFYPESTISVVDLFYISFPNEPVFDYVVQAGYITEGPDPVEYEWPEHLHMDLTRMILGYIGINMREQELQRYAEQHKIQGY